MGKSVLAVSEFTLYIFITATFEGTLTEKAELMNEMGKYVDAVVIITNQICLMEEVSESGEGQHLHMCVWPCHWLRVTKYGWRM